MKILFIGMSKKAGSAIMRGQQIASTRPNWDYKFKPTREEMDGYGAIVLVKQAKPSILADIDDACKCNDSFFFYDMLDFWGQDKYKTEEESLEILHSHIMKLFMLDEGVDVFIAPNQCMFESMLSLPIIGKCDVYKIPHHYDPNLPTPAYNSQVKNLVYYGDGRYIANWYLQIVRACGEAGWNFLINPQDLSCASAMIGARNGEYNCWINRNWKSGVKLATAEGLGIPFVHTQESSYMEYATENTHLFADEDELAEILVRLKPIEINDRFSLENCANMYERMFCENISGYSQPS